MTNFDRVVGLMGASVVAIACASPAMAQTRTYSIPAQSAASGVAALARQSDQQVLISARDAKGKKTREVRGEMTIEQAFAKLLAGSGLTAKRTGAGAWAVVQGGNAEAAPARAESSSTTTNFIDLPPAKASTVVDARTGAALKGALVEIVETGEKTSTGELGEFRFPGKTGSFNLRISYLGYPEFQQFVDLSDGRATTGILLADGDGTSEIVVTAYQSSRAQALNQERTADNMSTIISADLLGQFDGTTISDALRRAPGVGFQPNAETGEGANVIVRGLAPDFNTVTLNGQRIAVGSGTDRSPSLNNILADSISSITINKTLLPSQDSSGTGALIQIETKSPLDRPKRFANFGYEGTRSGKGFLAENLYSGTVSASFGQETQLGVSASVQYRTRNVERVTYSIAGSFYFERLPQMANGGPNTSQSDIDPRSPFPFEDGVDSVYSSGVGVSSSESEIRDLSITTSAQLKFGGHTDIRLDYTRAEQRRDTFTRAISFSPFLNYVPITGEDGVARGTLVWEDVYAPSLPGKLVGGAQSVQLDRDQKDVSQTLSLRGETNLGSLKLKYGAGMALAQNERPDYSILSAVLNGFFTDVPTSFLTEEAIANTVDGRIISPFAPRAGRSYPLPLLTNDGFAFFSDSANYMPINAYTQRVAIGRNKRISFNGSASYDFSSSFLKSLEAGAFYETSRLSNAGNDNALLSTFVNNPTLAQLGLNFGPNPLGRIGISSGFDMLRRAEVENFFDNFGSGSPFYDTYEGSSDALVSGRFTKEHEFAAFAQAKISIGNFEAIGGVRFENVKVDAAVINGPGITDESGNYDLDFFLANNEIVNISDTVTNILPRILINYRPDDNFVVRAGYYSTVARPSINQLNTYRSVNLFLEPVFGPNGNQPMISVSEGNPGLKPATTHNFDLSLEYYDRNIGVLKAGAFYKRTSNAFFDNRTIGSSVLDGVLLPDDPRFQNLPANIYVEASRPSNSPFGASLWGVEFTGEKRLDFLPGKLAGLGLAANVTLTRSSKTEYLPFTLAPDGFVTIRGAAYPSQPRTTGSAAVTYSRKGLDASLAYTFQSRYRTDYRPNNLHNYQEAVRTLDFHAQYQFDALGTNARIYIDGSDLLRGTRSPDIETSAGGTGNTPKIYTGASYIGGRTFRLGISASF